MNRQEKEDLVDQLTTSLSESEAVFVTDFKGLKVGEISSLRRKIDEAGGTYQVAKNTLIKRAIQGTPMETLADRLTGNNALGMTKTDPVSLAKTLVDFAKANDKFVVKGGILTGRVLEMQDIKAMADLPPREVLLAHMLGTFNAVPTKLVRVLAAVPQKLVYLLAAIRDQKEGQAV